jgi:drug/metabolite transporter (DMT)-like permease
LYIGGLTYALQHGGIDASSLLQPGLLGLYVLNVFCFGIGVAIAYVAYRRFDTSVVQTVSLLRVPVVAILSYILLGQMLSNRQLLGIGVILASLAIIVYDPSPKRWRAQSWTTFAAVYISPLMLGLGFVVEKATLNRVNIPTFMAFSWLMQVVWLLPFALKNKQYVQQVLQNKPLLGKSVAMGLLRFSGGFATVWLLAHYKSTGVVTAVAGLSVILTAILAALFLGETEKLRNRLGAAVLASLGVAIIFL